MKLAVVLVHYHTPELLRTACRAIVRDAEADGIELEGLVVDNGSRPEDRGLLETPSFRRLDPGRNLGYAGGVNLGLQESTAELAVVMNPDVEVLPGCLGCLVEALTGGAAAAGPRFYWDHRQRFLLPPTERVSRRSEILRTLAGLGGGWASPGRRAWRRHARRHWLAREPFHSYDLSGALLALRRSAWCRIGPFDEGYRLYFEETDWLQRLRRAGLPARFVPAAEAIHLYAQSVRREGRAEEWFLASSRRFRRRVFGTAFTSLLELASRRLRPGAEGGGPSGRRRGPAAWLEVSASPAGYPAAGHRLFPGSEPDSLPGEIFDRLAPGRYFLRTVDARGRDLGVRTVEKAALGGDGSSVNMALSGG